jgi:hypothetical protein
MSTIWRNIPMSKMKSGYRLPIGLGRQTLDTLAGPVARGKRSKYRGSWGLPHPPPEQPFSCLVGLWDQALGDISYGDRCIRRAHLMSDEECLRILVEIQERLVAAGIIKPDEDPFSEQIKLIGY